MLKFNIRDTRKKFEICSKLPKKSLSLLLITASANYFKSFSRASIIVESENIFVCSDWVHYLNPKMNYKFLHSSKKILKKLVLLKFFFLVVLFANKSYSSIFFICIFALVCYLYWDVIRKNISKCTITNFVHCVKSVRILSYYGPHFLAFGLNMERCSVRRDSLYLSVFSLNAGTYRTQ